MSKSIINIEHTSHKHLIDSIAADLPYALIPIIILMSINVGNIL